MKTITYATTPSLSPIINGELWEISKDWHVTVRGNKETLPRGFITDGASIPRILWRVCGHPMTTKRIIPAIVHDAIYDGTIFSYTRKEADEIFRDGIIEAGWPKWKAHIEYAALRLFGFSHWRLKTSTPAQAATAKVLASLLAGLLLLAGCSAPKAKSADVRGMYANAATETLAIGSARITILPESIESFVARYSEDTAWLSPSTKTHELEIFMTGTNATQSASAVIKSICETFAGVKGSAAAAPSAAPSSAPESPDSPTPTPTSN